MSKEFRVQDAIQWYEGMLMEPHHFQQNDQRLQQLFNFHTSLTRSFYWGVVKLQIDAVSLVGGLFRVTELAAVMPDALCVTLDSAATPLEFDLKKNLPDLDETPKTVFLVVNAYREGDGNAVGDFARFVSVDGSLAVDENTGERPLAFPRLQPKLSLFIGDHPPGHYVALPLARVVFQNNAYTLADYVPPALRVTIGSPLADMCMDLISRLRRKIAYLMGQNETAVGKAVVAEIRDSLRVFITALPPFEAIVYSGRAHPFDVFMAFAQLAGYLATLRIGVIPPVFDFYQHNDLMKSFTKVHGFVMNIIETIQDGYVVAPFTKTDRLYTLKLRPEFMGERFVLGAKTPGGAVDRDIEDWIKEAVIVTESYVKMAQDRRILGAKRAVIYGDEQLKLVPTKGMTLFTVTNDPAMIRSDESLVLFNLSDREGLRPSEIVLYIAREKELQNVA